MGLNVALSPYLSPQILSPTQSIDTPIQASATIGHDWQFPTPHEVKQELNEEFSEEEKSKVWSDAAEAGDNYYDQLVGRWKDEIDTLLVYAGLFSAVLTAFNVQSYQLLQPAPADPILDALQQISAQLNSFSVAPPFINSTRIGGAKAPQPLFHAPQSAVWINTLWFSSLVCSLASASIALTVKQWLHEATVGLRGTSRESARLRQHRLNGLLRWRVGSIILALPLLLQIALILFLVGMLVLLWTLHPIVALVTSSLVAILFTCFVVVMAMPIFQWECCYRSPQAFMLYTAIRLVYNACKRALDHLLKMVWDLHVRMVGYSDMKSLPYRVWKWNHFKEDVPTWHGRDQLTILRDTGALDRRIATTAYSTTLSPNYLDQLHVIMSDISTNELSNCLQDVWDACNKHWRALINAIGERYWYLNVQRFEIAAVYAARHMLTIPSSERDDVWRRRTKTLLEKLVEHVSPAVCPTELYVETLSALSLGKHELSWSASNRIAEYWMQLRITLPEVLNYSVIRSVLAASDWRLNNWKEEEYTFDNFKASLRAALCVLRCISRSTDNSNISPSQFQSICASARVSLVAFEHLLGEQEWTRLGPERFEVLEGRRDRWPSLMQHRFSSLMMVWVIQPLTEIYQNERARSAIPASLSAVLERTWSSVARSFPSPLDAAAIRSFGHFSAITTIAPALSTLITLAHDNTQRGSGCAQQSGFAAVAKPEAAGENDISKDEDLGWVEIREEKQRRSD